MSDEYDSFLEELDKELKEEKKSSKVHYAKIAYKKECEKRKKSLTTGIVITAVFELLVLAGVGYFAYLNNFHFRALYEFENILSGRITRESGVYVGSTDFGYFEGVGKFQFSTGTVYDGEWNENVMSGKGTLTLPDYGEYIGEFSGAKRDGIGTFTWSDGSVYKGEWEEDELNGDGEFRTDNGTIYKGTFKNNRLFTGTCQFRNKTGSYKLEYFEGNVKKAQITFKDGSYYEGESDGKTLSGKGKLIYADGDIYEGEFLAGKKSGKGKYTWATGTFYEGDWIEDQGNGEGVYSFGDGCIQKGVFKENRLVEGMVNYTNEYGDYVATVSDGIANKITITLADGTVIEGEGNEKGYIGKATISYPNGDKYIGEIKNGMKNGNGKYIWKQGASYDGSWENDIMSGKGTYFFTSDNYPKLYASFKDGKPEGEGTYTDKKQKSYKTTWKSGKCVKVTE